MSASDKSRDAAAFESLAAEILRKIKRDVDPTVLNEYRSLFRKNVPFFMRSYVGAYLLMKLSSDAGDKPRRGRRGEEKSREPKKVERQSSRQQERPAPSRSEAPVERKIEEPRKRLPEDEAVNLFVGAGRNRRVYARDLVGLILNKCGIDRDDLGDLRILDNFSFVQVRRSVADEIISTLDGMDFRGRALSVGYAKPRKDEAYRDGVDSESPESDPDEGDALGAIGLDAEDSPLDGIGDEEVPGDLEESAPLVVEPVEDDYSDDEDAAEDDGSTKDLDQ